MKTNRNILAALGLAACFCAPASAQSGPVTSNLKRVLVYIYNYAGDHTNTPDWCGYLMKLGTANGFSVDTTRNQSVFTPANLANYQVVVLFNAYVFGLQMSASQKQALRNWYGANRGMACFHQCVRHDWGGNYPTWYDSLMGVRYKTYAGFGSGPIVVNADAVGSELAKGADGTQYEANYTQSWDDEWYTYEASPANMPKTKMIWTTKRSAFNFGPGSSGFAVAGEVQPVAWAREAAGGRFVLNSLFHRDAARTSTNPQVRQFVDGSFLGTLRYLAGYTGCTDPASKQYNPKATHPGPGACDPTTIRVTGPSGKGPSESRRMGVAFTGPGQHSLQVFDSRGRKVFSVQGLGEREYGFQSLTRGVYLLKALSGGETLNRSFLLL
jgi:type 1 glutamine amidotransferase